MSQHGTVSFSRQLRDEAEDWKSIEKYATYCEGEGCEFSKVDKK